jgi:hypothetical protein
MPFLMPGPLNYPILYFCKVKVTQKLATHIRLSQQRCLISVYFSTTSYKTL